MLKIKPNCEWCDKDLTADSSEAMICSYECTFCVSCVNDLLVNVCPNCGGGFVPRPIRPKVARRQGVSLEQHPASVARIHSKYTIEEIQAFCTKAKNIDPKDR